MHYEHSYIITANPQSLEQNNPLTPIPKDPLSHNGNLPSTAPLDEDKPLFQTLNNISIAPAIILPMRQYCTFNQQLG